MIPTKSRRLKAMKLPRNIEKLYKEGKCRECTVVVTRMDFARILGKFTKVKIQYETSKKPRGKAGTDILTNSKTKQKTNENGLVYSKAYNSHSKDRRSKQSKENNVLTSKSVNTVLKENNRLKQPIIKDKNSNYNSNVSINTKFKQYGIMFTNPVINSKNDVNKLSLVELLPSIDDSILPSEEWCIDYFPKNDEPKDDKVYDRIAAELEDLMNNGKSVTTNEDKSDDFPSIMDILNDNTTVTNKSTHQSHSTEYKTNIESNDVESILMGKSGTSKTPESTPMEVDNTDVSTLIADVEQFSVIQTVNPTDANVPETCAPAIIENPHSPSILDEALQKGIEEHLPPGNNTNINEEETDIKPLVDKVTENILPVNEFKTTETGGNEENNSHIKNEKINILASKAEFITELVFKKNLNGQCCKSVTCPKNLKYKVELDGKSVEFIGAPKFISNLEELQILLQIVNESDLKSFYVLQ